MEDKKINDGGPAYPFQGAEWVVGHDGKKYLADVTYPGMSLRDHFAGLALSSPHLVSDITPTAAAAEVGMSLEEYLASGFQGYRALLAKRAYLLADAMIEARSNP